MKAVGIKALKNNLSKYLREVRSGETVWVTDRDEVIAEIHRPVVPIAGRISRWESWLNSQERSGALRRASSGTVSLSIGAQLPAAKRKVDLAALLDESRSERS